MKLPYNILTIIIKTIAKKRKTTITEPIKNINITARATHYKNIKIKITITSLLHKKILCSDCFDSVKNQFQQAISMPHTICHTHIQTEISQ